MINYGAKNVTAGLILAFDPFLTDRRLCTALGCGLYNGSTDGITNIINQQLYSFSNKVYFKNRDYYTAIGITYPEGNYGGDAAGRHGITPGLNVRTGTKLYTTGRGIMYAVFDETTSTWIPATNFNGALTNGYQTYDNYTYAESGYVANLNQLITDHNNIKAKYPNATHVMIGSHAADEYNAGVVNIMLSLGAPATVATWTSPGRPEWVLVGSPGLGCGNYYGWAYENYPTDPSAVAHLNFGVPNTRGGPMVFDSTSNAYINFASNINSGQTAGTWEFWLKCYSLPTAGNYQQIYIQENVVWFSLYASSGTVAFGSDLGNGSGWFDNNGGFNTGARSTSTISANVWYHVVYAWSGNTMKVYLNGVPECNASTLQAANGRQNVTTIGSGTTPRGLGYRGSGTAHWNGEMGEIRMYNRELSMSEVLTNYINSRKKYI
jgi:hypothetical protein